MEWTLRAIRDKDYPDLYIAQGPAVARWLSFPINMDYDKYYKFSKDHFDSNNEPLSDLGIYIKDKIVGLAYIANDELGYCIAVEHQGKGIVTAACTEVINRYFNANTGPEIKAGVHPKNEKSIRLLTKLGFVLSGRFEECHFPNLDMTNKSYELYSLTKEKWENR